MEEEQSRNEGHADEDLGWVAIEFGSGITAEGRRVDVFFAPVDHNRTPVAFPQVTAQRFPTVLGDVDSTFGIDTMFLRYAGLSSAQIELRLGEEQSRDAETAHTLEDVGIFVAE